MATKKPVQAAQPIAGLSFDLADHKRQRDELVQRANQAVSDKVEQIKALLGDIKDIVELSGIEIDIRGLKYDIESIEELHPDWNSSSYHC